MPILRVHLIHLMNTNLETKLTELDDESCRLLLSVTHSLSHLVLPSLIAETHLTISQRVGG